MILTYHKITFPHKRDNISTSMFSFLWTLIFLRITRKKIVYLSEYDPDNKNHFVITFDDGYREVLKYALPLLYLFRCPFEVFLVENFFNEAEQGNKNYLDKNDLGRIIKKGGRLQYHSKSHPRLDEIKDLATLESEIKVSEKVKTLDPKGFDYFAYPYWTYNDEVIGIVKKYYRGARSGNGHADGTLYAMDSKRM